MSLEKQKTDLLFSFNMDEGKQKHTNDESVISVRI
jgi:hypothetical protein